MAEPNAIAPRGRNAQHPEVGTWDHLEAFLGQRGTGKSTYQCARARDLCQLADGAYVIGHSIGARLPTKLPDEYGGGELPITYYRTIAKLAVGLRRNPGRWHILAPPPIRFGPRDTADDLLEFAQRHAESVKLASFKRVHPFGAIFCDPWSLKYNGIPSPPTVVLVDEGIAVDSAGTKGESNAKQKQWFKELLFSLRHSHIALLWSIQDPNAKSWQVLGQATLMHVFHLKHQWALNAIQAAGASDDELEQIEDLRRYEHVTVEISAPIGDGDELQKRADTQIPAPLSSAHRDA